MSCLMQKSELGAGMPVVRNYARSRMVVAGDLMRVNLYPVRRIATSRGAKSKVSRPAQAALNRRNAENRAKDIAHLTFTKQTKPLWVRLDYAFFVDKLGRNPTVDEAKKMAKAFLRILRRKYEQHGGDLKYMNFCHVGKKKGKVHHHILITGVPEGVKREDIEALWLHGYGNVVSVKYRNGSIAGLIAYSFEGADVYRSYSKNCKRPSAERYEDGSPASLYVRDGMISMKDVHYIDDNPDDLAFIRGKFPGYEISYVRKTPEYIESDTGLSLLPFQGPFVEIELYRCDGTDPYVPPRLALAPEVAL